MAEYFWEWQQLNSSFSLFLHTKLLSKICENNNYVLSTNKATFATCGKL